MTKLICLGIFGIVRIIYKKRLFTIKINFKPIPALFAGAVIISFSSVLVKISNVPPTMSAFYRVFFGSIILVFIAVIQKELIFKGFKKLFFASLCGLVFALDLWAWHRCINIVGPGLATILGNFQVFILSFAGFALFKEKISIRFLFAVPLAFFGLFIIIGLDFSNLSHNYLFGIGYGFATAMFYGFYLLLLRHIQSDDKDFSLFYNLMVLSIVCAICLGAEAYRTQISFVIPDIQSLISLLCLGAFIQALAWFMISNALPKVKASFAGLILLLQPALSFVWDVIFFNRPTGIIAWFGVLIVLMAIYLGMEKANNLK